MSNESPSDSQYNPTVEQARPPGPQDTTDGALPFSGLDTGVMIVVALAVLIGGLVMRRLARD